MAGWPPKHSPYDGPEPNPDPPPSQGSGGAPGQPPSSLPYQTAETGVALPTVYGTMRVAPNIAERYAYTFGSTEVAQIGDGVTYVIGDVRQNNGNLYVARTNGTTGTGTHPTDQTSGNVDGTVTWDYIQYGYRHFVCFAYCEGQIYGVGKAWQDKKEFAAYTDISHPGAAWLQLCLGLPGGDRPGISAGTTGWFPSPGVANQAMVYGNTALLYVYLNTGSDADLPETQLEIKGILADATHTDANPADIAIDLLTHARRGMGWPAARVDAVSTGTGNAASWKNYCTATGFVVSWLLDNQTSGLEQLKTLLAACNTDAVMTNRLDGLGWMIKFVPLGTDAITANGATFTPNLTPAYAITPDDLQDTMEMETVADSDRFNSMPIQYLNRARAYATAIVDDPSHEDVDKRGLKRANTTTIPMVMSPEAAIQLSRIKAQRSLYVSTKYRFSLPWKFLLIEPTDLLTFTEPMIGWNGQPVRVTAVEEDRASGRIKIEAEDFPANVGAAPGYTPQVGDPFKPAVGTALGSLRVLPGQAGGNVVPDSTSTRGGNVDNIWPNPTSEVIPPDGTDTSRPEWANRINAGAGAYAGVWVRELSGGAQHATAILGDPGPASADEVNLGVAVPAAPGESHYIEAQCKITSATNGEQAGVWVDYLNAAGASLGNTNTTVRATAPAASWGKVSASSTAPAGTVKVRFYLWTHTTLGASTAQFDAIYARRQIGLALFPVEPWNATRLIASCQILVNAAGTTVTYQTGYGAFGSGFDQTSTPTLVQVGVEPQKRLRLTLADPPNGVLVSNCKPVVHTQRMPNGLTPVDGGIKLLLHGWNLANKQFDFFATYTNWGGVGSGGSPTVSHPLAWNGIDPTNGSIWDVTIILVATPVYKFF